MASNWSLWLFIYLTYCVRCTVEETFFIVIWAGHSPMVGFCYFFPIDYSHNVSVTWYRLFNSLWTTFPQHCGCPKGARRKRSPHSADLIRGRRGGGADWDSRCKIIDYRWRRREASPTKKRGAASVPKPHPHGWESGEPEKCTGSC